MPRSFGHLSFCRAGWYTFWYGIDETVSGAVSGRASGCLDEAIGLGSAENRSSAIVISMQEWLERERRKRVGAQIVAEYVKRPQTAEETAWVRAASEASIAAEPW